MRTALLGIVLFAIIVPAHAQQQAHGDRLGEDVWERMLTRLETLPGQWDQLPPPAVPSSGRLPDEVIDTATEIERQAADALLSRLVRASPQERARLLAEFRDQHASTEVVLWWPLRVARRQQLGSFDEAALTLDAWLDLAEHLGRRDALLHAAGAALGLARRRLPVARVAIVAQRWSTLTPGPHDDHGIAAVSLAHGRILLDTGSHDEALETYRRARQLYTAVGDENGQANTWDGEAQALYLLGRTDDALNTYRQARARFRDLGDELGQGQSLRGEGTVLFRIGQIEAALHTARQARALFQDIGSRAGLADSWHGEAAALFRLGHNDRALHAYRQARSLFHDLGDELGQGHTWLGEARVLSHLGQEDGALHAFRQARALYRDLGNKLGEGNSWHGEASVLVRLGHDDAALTAFRQARALFVDVGSKLSQGNTWNGEAEVLFRLGQNHGALTAYRQARALFRAVSSNIGQTNSWQGEALVLLRLHELHAALHAAENATMLARSVGSIEDELLSCTYEARILFAAGKELRAIRRAEHALGLLRGWSHMGVSDLDRTSMSNWSGPYDLLIPFLARKRGRAVEKALALAEEAHAPVLLDLLATGSRRPEGTSDLPLRGERKRLQHELAALDRTLHETIAPGERQKLRLQRETIDAQLQLNELMALGSLDSTLVSGAPIDARTRHELVRDIGPVLLYYVAEDEIVAFLLRSGHRTPLVRRTGLARSRLQSEVQALRHELANASGKQGAGDRQRALFDWLVAPLADALAETPRVTIVPHGPLHELPFEALLDADGVPLFERWHVTVAPSLSVLQALRQRRATRQPSPGENAFLGIAAGTGLSLPYREVNEASAWFGPTACIIGPHSDSRAAYTELAPDARHILISSHGKHVARSRSGYLELGGPDGVPTRLTAGDIAHIPLRAELVTLAACETARGEAMQSDERLDLTRAFLIAGADAVLATRWRVPEHPSTQQFLLDFYQALHQGGPGGTRLRKDEAVTHARRRSLARGDHAQLWAAWVLVGDAR